MSEGSSLSKNESALADVVTHFLGIHPDFKSSRRSQPGRGTMLWQWGGSGRGARLWKTLAYRDVDGATVIVTILRRGEMLSEIELLRGDNNDILSVASSGDMKEITKAGVIDLD